MGEGDVCDAGLVAVTHIQCVNAGEVGEGGVCDAGLSTASV